MIAEVSKRNRLSLEQLKQMDGEPIWVEVIVENCIEDGYALVSVYDEYCMNEKGEFFKFEDYGRIWVAYLYSPIRVDKSKWMRCEFCKSNKRPIVRSITNRFPVAGELIYFHDTISGWEFQSINFCPYCGFPLTKEGWTELERRLNGEICKN